MARDWFAEAFGAAASDVRAKLIEEAWFGRRTPEPHRQADPGGARDDHPAFGAPDTTSPEPDHGIDR